MPVKYKIFPIPITNPEEQEEALNQFLCMHKIVTIHKEIIQEQSRHYVNVLNYCLYHDSSDKRKIVSKDDKILPVSNFKLIVVSTRFPEKLSKEENDLIILQR